MIDKPHGLAALTTTFGDPLAYVNNKGEWERRVLATRNLVKPLRYAYGAVAVDRVRAHLWVVGHLADTLMLCLIDGVPVERLHYGGCYSWRPKRTNSELSTHTWGIAVDLEPAANPMGKPWVDDGAMLHPTIVKVFLDMGWTWGNDFPTHDVMHWQWVSGY